MKLKNKKTGKITKLDIHCIAGKNYESLAELSEDWEDYIEEPKEYWFINELGNVEKAPSDWFCDERDSRESIGNYFETREEAEKAVEKLKAWKRLKDKGFRFVGRSIRDLTITYSFDNYDEPDIPQMNKDLNLLFGGEE